MKEHISERFDANKEKLSNGFDEIDLLKLKDKVRGLKDDMHKVSTNFSDRDWKIHNGHIDSILQDIDSTLKLKEVGIKAANVAKQPLTKISSIRSNHSADGETATIGEHFSKFGDDLTTRRKKLQQDLEDGTNISVLRTKVAGLREDLHKHAPDLSPYEVELHNKHIDKLVKDVDDKLKLSGTKDKVFQFAKTPISRLSSRGGSGKDNGFEHPIIDGKATFMDLDFVLLDSNKVYKSLERCTLSSTDYNDKPKAGSLTIQYIENSVISLQSLPFKNGSIFISDASNCVLVLHMPKDDKVQLRLHNLYKCKMLILCDDYLSSKQTVVIENCKECIFHQSSETHLTIENFNNVTKSKQVGNNEQSESTNDYKFDEFDTYLGNIQNLKQHYVR
ncbi:similar to Saccharomyces cerevisiae YPL241C CIN2 GTPase-activating protein (GAP) for Cin4p [Maudiozyma barnettii]|uniref:Similar to Saccharomyces cerevisiae YPL241C CIN2 GTPase-activating protein (GAP) for Cin4p n=1 Tax=Maudiozyma barnettii TaxID=61262 RepID=A0A8H2VGT0_9SACH|nr:GTPase-activating protein CIN2 [Kazachstania barnettii]CAB4255379.1 similar to Saccharomyces cerevisiae YPL241C CIN2 GTPase-activating protein (GAP) for Cin4p [Kazachstania barnettii]CAD1783785.1 similar to Saccharomyces cerevisiae YPL241C CIN2 GTPase-activating protein (GAP) for Cin4p [Kazachstania barnettii]